MGYIGGVWTLHHSDRVIGRIAVDKSDFPWLEGAFEALPGFEAFAPGFERSLRLLDAEENEEWEAVYTGLVRELSLHAPEGPVAEFLLHIEDGRAWFRWADA